MGRASIQSEDTSPDFKEIRARFFAQNNARLKRAKDDMRLRQLEFVEILPLLYHINHPLLPGYVNKNTPAGLPEYSPSAQALVQARRIGKSFSYKKRAYRKFPIQAIYIMGSTGTIGYSSGSDIDVWVCYDSDLDAEQIADLKTKSAAIEAWAETLEVDAHIFLVDPEQFAKGRHGQLSHESSGSALHYLLLEEFYRSSLLLAGRMPLWWLVPPEHEQTYDDFVADIKLKRYLHSRDHIDFGGLQHITAEEFYGATLWLLYKGIHSPYKSVIKTMLMESYASEYPKIELLCFRLKRYVYQGENEINKLDPYLMMLHKVEEYLHNNAQQDRLELIRRSFYFKVNEKLSEASNNEEHWRRQLLSELVRAWGWSTSQLFILDSKNNWNIPRVVRERNALIQELTHSYKFLSEFARNKTQTSLIKPADLTVLGRKLYATFERKTGKIEIIFRGITHHLNESHLSLHRLLDKDQRDYWVIFSGVVSESEIHTATPLKRTYHLIELIAWCFFNKILSLQTITNIIAPGSDLTDKELTSIVTALYKNFDDALLTRDNITDLRKPAYIIQMLTLINVGMDPFITHTRRGEHLTSNRTDSLRFGGRLENLTLSLDQVVVTSWQEVLTFHYDGIEGLFKCLQDYMNWAPPMSQDRPPLLNCQSFSSYRGNAISNRVESLFNSIIDCFYDKKTLPNTYYIMAIEWDYYALSMNEDHLHWVKLGNMEKLREFLSSPSEVFRHFVFDPSTFNDDIVAHLYAHNRPGMVQCFIHVNGERATTHVLDERGSYFSQETEFYDAASLLSHYQQFYTNIYQRMQYARDKSVNRSKPPLLEFYFINKNNKGQWTLLEHSSQLFKTTRFISLQALVDNSYAGLALRIYCNDREFTTLDSGSAIYQDVARHILNLRNGHKKYPIYITDIDLSPALLDATADIQTVHYLNYKKQIETALQEQLGTL